MSLVALKRKTQARYGRHSSNGFSINGTSRYPSYIGKGSLQPRSSASGASTGDTCCAYETNKPDGFNTVKNYNAVNKHGRLTKWYKEDYTIEEWNEALSRAGLNINDYPYPQKGKLQKVHNNWVQSNDRGDGTSHMYTHIKRQEILENELKCSFVDPELTTKETNCVSKGIMTETGIIKHQCTPIVKTTGSINDSSNAIERAKHRRGLLNPQGYDKPFPYNTTSPTFRSCKSSETQSIDALVNGYFNDEKNKTC